MSTVLRMSVMVAAMFASPLACADMYAARAALLRGDAATAYREYEVLAQLGNPTAQYYAGVMLLKGQGTPRDVISGVAWILAARDSGLDSGEFHTDAVLAALTAEQTQAAREVADSRMREAAALRPMLFAKVPDTEADRYSKMAHATNDGSLWNAFRRKLGPLEGGFGWAHLHVVVDADGEPSDLWSAETAPSNLFGIASIELSRQMAFTNARQSGRAVASSFPFFLKHGPNELDRVDTSLKVSFMKLMRIAHEGNKDQRYALVRMVTVFPELRALGLKADQALVWMRELAAEPERGAAMYFLPVTMRAAGLPKLPPDEEFQWRLRSAQAGFAAAQLDMALMCWSEHAPTSQTRTRRWLEPASAGSFAPASRYLVALLLSPELRQESGARALALVKPLLLNPLYKTDADTWQLAAVAYAVLGQSAEAVQHQQKAMAFLRNPALKRAGFEARLVKMRSAVAIDDELLAIPAAGQYSF